MADIPMAKIVGLSAVGRTKEAQVAKSKKSAGESRNTSKPMAEDPKIAVDIDRYIVDVDKNETFANMRFMRHSGTCGQTLIPRGDLRVPSKIRAVLDPQGVNYTDNDLARVGAAHQIEGSKVTYCYSQLGWRKDKFGFPGRTIHEDGRGLIMLPVDDSSPLAPLQQSAGNMKEWLDDCCRGFATSSYAIFAFGVCCAAPVQRFSKTPEGGIFAFSGPSGSGKTTICAATQAIMGNPAKNLLPTWDGTDAGFKDLLGDTCDTLVILDDTSKSKMSPRERLASWEHIAHAVSGGGKRTRARSYDAQHGASSTRRPALALTSGEVSPEELAFLTGQKIRGGARVRFMDIPLPPIAEGAAFDLVQKDGLGGEIVETAHMAANWLTDRTAETYGVAFPTLLGYLEEHYGTLAARVPEIETSFVQHALAKRGGEADSSDHRIAVKFGLVFAGLTFAIEAGIFNISVKAARRAVMVCFMAAMRSEDARRDERPRQIRRLKKIFRNPSIAQLQYSGAQPSRKLTAFRRKWKGKEVGFIRFDQIGAALSISDTEVRALISDLASQGALVTGTGGDRTRPMTMSDGKQLRHYGVREEFYTKDEKRVKESSTKSGKAKQA